MRPRHDQHQYHRETSILPVAAIAVLAVLLPAIAAAPHNQQEDARGQEEARELISILQSDIHELKGQGIPSLTVEAGLRAAQEATSRGDFSRARIIAAQASKEKIAAISSSKAIKRTNDVISLGERRWQAMSQSKNMIFLAKQSYQRGDFTTALDRAGQAEVLANVELKATNWKWVVYTYRWQILGAIAAILIISRIAYAMIRRSNITKRIDDLSKEEINIIKLIRETQENHFNKKELSAAQFHKTMFNHYHQLYANRAEMAALRRERLKRGNITQELETLQREEQDVMNLIKAAQEDHFVKKITTLNEYNLTIDEYHDRLADVENSLITLQREASASAGSGLASLGARKRRSILRPLRDALMRIMIPEQKQRARQPIQKKPEDGP